MIVLEICASSIESVVEAKKGGATRVELCDNLSDGGTTPPLSWVEKSIEITDIQTFVLTRPRSGDFLYSNIEFEIMKKDIIHCGKTGCHGVALGILKDDGKVDKARCEELIELACSYNMSVTFHRAIDRTVNIFEAMEDIIELGCDRILTSGGEKTVEDGIDTIKKMIQKADGRIIIMPGSGINADNIVNIKRSLNTNEFHGTFRSKRNSKMKYIKDNIDSYENDYTVQVSSSEIIRTVINLANNI